MKWLSTFVLVFLAVSGSLADHNVEKRGLFDLDKDGILDDLLGGLTKLINNIIDEIKNVAGALLDDVRKILKALTSDVKEVVDFSLKFLHTAVDDFAKRWPSFSDEIIKPSIDEFNKLLNRFEAELSAEISVSEKQVNVTITDFYSMVQQVTSEGFNKITDLVKDVFDKNSKDANDCKQCNIRYILQKFVQEQMDSLGNCINEAVSSVKTEVVKLNIGIRKATASFQKIINDASVCLMPLLTAVPDVADQRTAYNCFTKVKDAAIISTDETSKELVELSETVVANIGLAAKNLELCTILVEKQAYSEATRIMDSFASCCNSS